MEGFHKIIAFFHELPKEYHDCSKMSASLSKMNEDLHYYMAPEHWAKFVEHIHKKMIFSMIDLVGLLTEAYLGLRDGNYYQFGENLGKALSLLLTME
jgi:hypothetical protein